MESVSESPTVVGVGRYEWMDDETYERHVGYARERARRAVEAHAALARAFEGQDSPVLAYILDSPQLMSDLYDPEDPESRSGQSWMRRPLWCEDGPMIREMLRVFREAGARILDDKVQSSNQMWIEVDLAGFGWKLTRADLTCELVETGEVEEVEVEEVVEKRTVKKLVPVTERRCPDSLLAD